MRKVKTASELKAIRTVCDIADAAFAHIIKFIKPGMAEIEVSNELEFFMRRAGATSSSFDTIVASVFALHFRMVLLLIKKLRLATL